MKFIENLDYILVHKDCNSTSFIKIKMLNYGVETCRVKIDKDELEKLILSPFFNCLRLKADEIEIRTSKLIKIDSDESKLFGTISGYKISKLCKEIIESESIFDLISNSCKIKLLIIENIIKKYNGSPEPTTKELNSIISIRISELQQDLPF